MDRKIWLLLSLTVRVADKRVPPTGRHCRFDDRLIVRMFLWAASHDYAPLWACDRMHYSTLFRPRVRGPSGPPIDAILSCTGRASLPPCRRDCRERILSSNRFGV